MAYTTIKKPSDYFNTKLYTGNGSTQSVTGVGFAPDWVWIKNRTSAEGHGIFDAVRGVTKMLSSANSDAETTTATSLTAFGSDGFSVGSNLRVNQSSNNFASWNWLANGAGVSNTDGDITSTVSANTTSGFSIVKYTGNGTQSDQEIGTGLSTELKFVIAKPLEAGGTTSSWLVYVNGITDAQDNCLLLESTSALITGASGGTPNKGTTAGNLLSKAGTASNNNLNNSGTNYIAYCFAEKQGYSKFGSYTGNGNADGAFVYLGFKPAFVIIKNIDAAESWQMFDGKRPDSNQTNGLYSFNPNTNSAEFQNAPLIDFLSNGFKLRTATNSLNVTQNYIYMAFAEQPLVGDNPCTAR